MTINALVMEGKAAVTEKKFELDDEPGFGEIQVEIKACGICAWDSYLFKGVSLTQDYPFRFGHEGAGIVRKIGPGVRRFKAGDKVFLAGGPPNMSQVVNAPENIAGAIPDSVEDFSKWVGEPVCCAVNGIDQLGIRPGETAVLIGAGYMGLLLVQGLVHSLLGRLVVFDIDDRRLALARKFGCREAYNSATAEGKAALEELKGRGGVEIVIEASGTEPGFVTANSLLKDASRLELFAWHRAMRSFDGTLWHLKGIKVMNTAPNYDIHYLDRIPQSSILMGKGIFRQDELVTHVVSYTRAQEALEVAVSKDNGYIKGVITF
jgi:threonine dehydrogenase-like Zn-dependent dehydrogenase